MSAVLRVSTIVLALLATPALAEWSMERLPADAPEFAVFTNDLGRLAPDTTHEILIHKSEAQQQLGPNGTCSFQNCTISVVIDGLRPAAGERVEIYFSQGDLMEVPAASDHHIFSNNDWDGKFMTNQFAGSVASAEWVIVQFGDQSHRFTLRGASDAFASVARAVN